MCADRKNSKLGGILTVVVLAVVMGAGIAGYIFYKYRLRVKAKITFLFFVLNCCEQILTWFSDAVLHGLRDNGYHVAIHASR